jgi:GAF domain-containing protein
MGAATPRRPLRLGDIAALAEALRGDEQPARICRAVAALSADVIGHRLFTVMRFDADRQEVERVHSTVPAVYPPGGRKRKKDTPWADHVLRDRKVFRANDPDGIRAAFDDHATILGLGLGSVLNIPIGFDGRCVGTMNLLHQAGWYTKEDEATGLVLAAFLLPALVRTK